MAPTVIIEAVDIKAKLENKKFYQLLI